MKNKMAHPSEKIKGHNIWSQPCIQYWLYHSDLRQVPAPTTTECPTAGLRTSFWLPTGAAGSPPRRSGPRPGSRLRAPRGADPANQRPRGGWGGGAARAEQRAKQRHYCRPGADHASLTGALPAAASAAATAGPRPPAPPRGRPAPGVRSVPAGALSRARALPGARHSGARRMRLLRALPGRGGRELRGADWRALWPGAGVREPHRGGGARGHRALCVCAARRRLRFRRPLLSQYLRPAPACPASASRAPRPPAQGARRPL